MRRRADRELIEAFARRIGAEAKEDARIYFTGGVSAVLLGWRTSTVDLDISIVPERDSILRAIPELKESLHINVELAAPSHFIPELPGWEDRSRFIVREGRVSFYHYDFYSQALAKIERGHARDTEDVKHIFAAGLVEPERLLELFERVEGELYRYPSLDAASFRRRVEEAIGRD